VTTTHFRVTMMLCDHAQVAEGKLYISGGGWSVTTTPTRPSSVAVLLQVPWTQANRKIDIKLRLVGSDGEPVTQPNATGQTAPVEIAGNFEVGRPAGLPEGTLLDAPLAITIPPLLLQEGRYVWELWLDGENREDWQVAFMARASGPGIPQSY
jgi:hypothetical protein